MKDQKYKFSILLLILPLLICGLDGTAYARKDASEWDSVISIFGGSAPEIVIIKLKNKGTIKGVIVEEREEGIIVDVGFGTVAVQNSEIESVEVPEGEDKKTAAKEWKGHMLDTKRNIEKRKDTVTKVRNRNLEYLGMQERLAEKARMEAEYRIKFKDSSKIIVGVILNGEVWEDFIIDTGASKVLVPMSVANKLFKGQRRFTETVETKLADGSVRQGVPVVLKSVDVGGARAENVEAIIMELRGQTGLLGMSFLNKFHMRIDSKKNELILKEK
ncbi:MAG: retroviral-like aspartic protease family protein [Candidatus Omnitrophica bacterium]|nr:retroviral-like aspartic protease family protein [Candidatus Omnitrophota bacterium]